MRGETVHRIVWFATVMALGLLWSPAAFAQNVDASPERGPRFLIAAAGAVPPAPPAPVDVSSVPTLRDHIAVHVENATLDRALRAISARTGIHFIYSRDVIPGDRRVTLNADDITVAAALTEILMDARVDVVLGGEGQVALVARTPPRRGEILGRVVDAVTRRPIVSAHVEVVGSGSGAETDSTGAFRLRSVPPGVVSLRATAVSYLPVVRTDVVVGATRPATVLLALSSAPLQMSGITVGPSYFATPQEAPTSTQRLNAEEMRRLPGAQEDAVRALSLLPGVGPTAIHRNDLIVRGGAPFENLFVVDGLEVPNINHFAAQGSSGGQVSLINLDFIRRLEFSAGGFGAPNGDRVGSVTTIELREGTTDRHAGEVNLSATGFSGIAEGPLGQGSYLVGIRRSYLDLILDLAGEPFFARYWDANVKITQRLSSRDKLSWMFVGAMDEFGFNIETPEDRYDATIMAVNDDPYFTALTWSHSSEQSLLTLTGGRIVHRFDTFQQDTLGAAIFDNQSIEAENSLRLDYERMIGDAARLELGTVAKYNDRLQYDIDFSESARPDASGTPQPLDLDTSFTAFRVGSYGELTARWTPRFSTTLGGRVDYYEYLGDAVRVAPRLAATLDLGGATTLNMSGGRYWQAPSFIWLMGDPSNRENLRPFRVDQVVVGVQKLLREDLKLQLEGYYKRYGSYPTRVWHPEAVLTPAVQRAQTDIPFGLEPLTSEGTGSAIGAELFLQKRLSTIPVYGTASISVNRTRFTALDGESRVGSYDSPFVANLAVGWRPSPSWDLGLRFRLATGLPKTPYISSGPLEGRFDFERYNDGGRMPTFHALDIRVDHRWTFQGLQLTTYLDVQDVYNRNNPIAYVWDDREGAPRYETAIGFLPSLGINVAF